MFCTKCGAQAPDDVQFCTQCGAPLQQDVSQVEQPNTSASTPTPQVPATSTQQTIPNATSASLIPPTSTSAQQPTPKKKGVLIAILAVLVVVLIGVIVLVAINPFASSENSSQSNNAANNATSTASESASPTSQEPEPTVIARTPNGDIRIDMPEKYADQGYHWEYVNNELRLQNKDDITAIIIYQGNYTLTYEEAVADYYGLGTTIISGKTTPVNMKVLFWQKDSSGLGLIHGADPIGNGKPSLDFIGITPQEVASWVVLEQNESYHNAVLTEPNTISEQSPTAASSQNTPFYGIWIGAFSEKSRAEAFCNETRDRGLNAEIFLSNQWTNLNQDPYWVVAAFVTPSEQIAERQLMSIQSLGYTNAYVKYSGDYKG